MLDAYLDGFWVLDRRLPRWARRSNPIIRRHLGGFWKAQLPELETLWRLYALQAAAILLSLLLPGLLELGALVGLVSFFVLPPGLVIYGWALAAIGSATASAVIEEREHNALDLLRTTPFSLRFILLSKIAAAVWRQVPDLALLVMVAALFSLPPIILEHTALPTAETSPYIPHLMMLLGLAASIIRPILEPVMIGALGVLIGAVGMYRISSAVLVSLLGLTYFLFLNLPRLLPLAWPLRLLVETVLPLALPLLLTWGALRGAEYFLLRD